MKNLVKGLILFALTSMLWGYVLYVQADNARKKCDQRVSDIFYLVRPV